MAGKDSFVLYNSYYDLIEDLDMEQRGVLLTAILEHSLGIEHTNLDPITKLAYRVITSQLDRDRKKWEQTCKKRAEAGRRGGLAKANKAKQNLANLAEYDSENGYEDDYDDAYKNESGDMLLKTERFFSSIRERFIESFGRAPDRPFLSGLRRKFAQVSAADVIEIIEIARDKQPGNPEAYIIAALNDRGLQEQPPSLPTDKSDHPLEPWEQDWIAEVQRRREQIGGMQL